MQSRHRQERLFVQLGNVWEQLLRQDLGRGYGKNIQASFTRGGRAGDMTPCPCHWTVRHSTPLQANAEDPNGSHWALHYILPGDPIRAVPRKQPNELKKSSVQGALSQIQES